MAELLVRSTGIVEEPGTHIDVASHPGVVVGPALAIVVGRPRRSGATH